MPVEVLEMYVQWRIISKNKIFLNLFPMFSNIFGAASSAAPEKCSQSSMWYISTNPCFLFNLNLSQKLLDFKKVS